MRVGDVEPLPSRRRRRLELSGVFGGQLEFGLRLAGPGDGVLARAIGFTAVNADGVAPNSVAMTKATIPKQARDEIED